MSKAEKVKMKAYQWLDTLDNDIDNVTYKFDTGMAKPEDYTINSDTKTLANDCQHARDYFLDISHNKHFQYIVQHSLNHIISASTDDLYTYEYVDKQICDNFGTLDVIINKYYGDEPC